MESELINSSFAEKYEIEPSIQWIKDNSFKRVSLQFPVELYSVSTYLLLQLQGRMKDVEFAIIAEKKYTSCCLDELGAAHFHADCILHFGDSCLTPPLHLATRFIFNKEDMDINIFKSHIKVLGSKYSKNKVVLFYHLSFHHLREKLISECKECFSSFSCPPLLIPERPLVHMDSMDSNNNKDSVINDNNINNKNDDKASLNYENNNNNDNTNNSNNDAFSVNDNEKGCCKQNIDVGGCIGGVRSCCMDGSGGGGQVKMAAKSSNTFTDISTESDTCSKDTSYDVATKGTNGEGSELNKQRVFIGRVVDFEDGSDIVVLYVGGGNDDEGGSTNGGGGMQRPLMLVFNKGVHVGYDAKKGKVEEIGAQKLLMRRYYLVEKARDAQFVGILMQTFETPFYLELTKKVKMAAKKAGKKARIYSPGVLNCAKLANMADFELFVVVACVRGSLPDHSEFLQPIITPFEFLVACSSSSSSSSSLLWSDSYTLDFKELIDRKFQPIKSENRTDVSLVTGKIRRMGDDDDTSSTSNDRQVSKASDTVATISADRLQERSWKGLELNLGRDAVSELKEGSYGTATVYKHESQK